MTASDSRGGGAGHGPNHRLADVPLFARLPATALDTLAGESRVRRYPAGQVLWHEGDAGDALVVLEEGQLRVSRFTSAGGEVVLSVVDAPGAVGELALLDGAPRDAAVIAQRPVVVRLISRTVFLNLLSREPAAVDGLLRTLAGMVRAGNRRHVAAIGLDVPGRLAAWLLERANREPGTGKRTELVLGRSQGELAAELGATRSTLNRALKGFEALGLLSVDGERLVLRDLSGLAAYAEELGGGDLDG